MGNIIPHIRKLPNGKIAELQEIWARSLPDIHPRRLEVPFNNIDDDCDGAVDETEFEVTPYGDQDSPGSFTFTVRINDAAVQQYATALGVHVFDLSKIRTWLKERDRDWLPNQKHVWDVEELVELKRIKRGDFRYTVHLHYVQGAPPTHQMHTISPIVPTQYVAYQGADLQQVRVRNLPNENKVYVVVVHFYIGGVDTYERISCINEQPTGPPVYTTNGDTVAGRCLDDYGNGPRDLQNMVTSELFFTMIEKVGEKGVKNGDRSRRMVVNKRFEDYWRARSLGEIGGDRAPASTRWPSGTYYGASYNELWCTEFVSATYGRSMHGDIGGATHISEMLDYFRDENTYWSGPEAREHLLGYAENPAGPGDYLAIEGSCSGEKTHSVAIVDIEKGNTNSGVWIIEGNFDNRLNMRIVDVEFQCDSKGGRYKFNYLGQLSDESPKHIP